MIVPLTPLEFRQRAVTLFGNKVGVVDGDKRFTYAQYDKRVNRLANALTGLGVGAGETVSFITYNTHQLLEAYYAVPQISGILNPINIRLTHHEIEYILNHAGTKVLCFHADFLPLVEDMRERLSVSHYVIMESEDVLDWAGDYEALLAAASPEAEVNLDEVDENAIVELFYTSGTTGPPKGVAITNRALYLHTLNAIISFGGLRDDATFLHVVPLFHVNGWGTPQYLTALGGKHVMLRKVDFGEILRLVEEEKVTRLLGVPTIFNGILMHPDLEKHDLSSLEEVMVGGAPSPLSLIKALEEQLACRAVVGYGLTETTPVLSTAHPKEHLKADEETRLKTQVKTGLPIIGVRMRVVDADGNDVPRDGATMGEIVVRSNVVMDGYFKDPQATEQVIRDGWFHTGDVAVWDEEGYFTITDRMKDIIISGGENISSVEVEKVLYGHAAVLEAVVIGVPDEKWGEVPHAIVVCKPGESVTPDELIAYMRERLAGFKIPKQIEIRTEELPKGGTGKILKRDLREPYWAEMERQVN